MKYNNIATSSILNKPGNMSDVYEYISLFTSYLKGTSRSFHHLFFLCPITKIEQRKKAIEPFSDGCPLTVLFNRAIN